VFITARPFQQNSKSWVAGMRRLATKVMPPGGSSSGTQKQHGGDESLGANHHPPGGFWKISKNTKLYSLDRVYALNKSYISYH